MPKKLIILSDGTGNSAATVWRTNVWRVYEALDLAREDHIAFYDDGVGTSSFKPLALLGSAFGWGLKRNIIHQYAFLCRNYEPGDEIFAFGFSRGAFTIRRIVGIVTHIGLLDGRGKSDAKLRAEARAVYRLSRRSPVFYPTQSLVLIFRLLRDLFVKRIRKEDIPAARRKVRIRFLGLWDTVAAYGLPMYEMTRAVDLYYWPMSMRDRFLSPRVARACHALSLDDERTTFHPLLWNEKNVRGIFGGLRSENITRIDQERISQVWFAGMHANVGGGYPDDGMAHVPLDWIIGEAEKCGLKFKRTPVVLVLGTGWNQTSYATTKRDEIRIAGDPSGRIYNSRGGLGGYYRYGPRRLDDLNNDNYNKVTVQLPKIHESVFTRLKIGIGGYASFVLPERYSVVRGNGAIEHGAYEHSTQSTSRARLQEAAWDWVWARRIIYFATLGASLHVAIAPWRTTIGGWVSSDVVLAATFGRLSVIGDGLAWLGIKITGGWMCLPAAVKSPVESVAHYFDSITTALVPKALKLAAGALPGFLGTWLEFYEARPTWITIWAGIIAVLIYIGVRMENRIDATMRAIWNPIVDAGADAMAPAAISPEPSNMLYRMRTSEPYRRFIFLSKQWILPTLFALAFAIIAIAMIRRLL